MQVVPIIFIEICNVGDAAKFLDFLVLANETVAY
jgi:hypothetical protein